MLTHCASREPHLHRSVQRLASDLQGQPPLFPIAREHVFLQLHISGWFENPCNVPSIVELLISMENDGSQNGDWWCPPL